MKKGTKGALDEERIRTELLGIADDLRAVELRARALNAALTRTADFRRARAQALKSDDAGVLKALPWFWSGGLDDVITSLKGAGRQCRTDARVTAREVARQAARAHSTLTAVIGGR